MDTIVTLGRPSVVPSVVAAGVGTTSLLYILYKRWINDIRVPESFPEAYDLREVLKIIKKINLLVSNSSFSRRPYLSVSFIEWLNYRQGDVRIKDSAATITTTTITGEER